MEKLVKVVEEKEKVINNLHLKIFHLKFFYIEANRKFFKSEEQFFKSFEIFKRN